MLNALLLASVLTTTPRGCGCHETLPTTPIERIIYAAWQADGDQQKIDPKHQKELDNDTEQGKKWSADADKELKASKNAEYIKRVETIGQTLAAIANTTHAEASWGDKRMNPFKYTFKVVEGEDVNAFSLPGGYIYVYEGLIKYIQSDDELAGVLAHEIAHASFRHVATLQREQSKMSWMQIPAILLLILSHGSEDAVNVVRTSQVLQQAQGSGWSQRAEDAADSGGFQYMLKSKYNPAGMLTMMERLAMDERARPQFELGIFRSHPPSKERAGHLGRLMSDKGLVLRRSEVTTSYRTDIKPSDDGRVDIWFSGRKLYSFAGDHALPRATDAAKRLDAFFDSLPQLFQVTLSDDGFVRGKGQVLFKVEEEDAIAAKSTVPALMTTLRDSVGTVMATLPYRVWTLPKQKT